MFRDAMTVGCISISCQSTLTSAKEDSAIFHVIALLTAETVASSLSRAPASSLGRKSATYSNRLLEPSPTRRRLLDARSECREKFDKVIGTITILAPVIRLTISQTTLGNGTRQLALGAPNEKDGMLATRQILQNIYGTREWKCNQYKLISTSYG